MTEGAVGKFGCRQSAMIIRALLSGWCVET
jgi:hypothetical protein